MEEAIAGGEEGGPNSLGGWWLIVRGKAIAVEEAIPGEGEGGGNSLGVGGS